MSTTQIERHADTLVTAKCRQIRRSWTESEKKLRALRANLAQSHLAMSILFGESRMNCPK